MGEVLWSRLFGDTFKLFSSVVVDEVGNAYVVGSSAGGKVMGDALLRKYDPTGQEPWTRQFGTPKHDAGIGVAVDREGHVYAAGRTHSVFRHKVLIAAIFLKPSAPIVADCKLPLRLKESNMVLCATDIWEG